MRYFVLFACLIAMPLQAGELYRWLDSAGRVHYGNSAPRDASQVETRKFPDAGAPSQDMPYETRLASKNFPVTLYVGEGCVEPCQQARDALNKRGIPFSEKNLVIQQEIDAFKAVSGSDSLPTLSVGRHYLRGFLAKEWHSELDIAGYPKSLPYRVPAYPVAPAASQVAPTSPATP